MLSRTLSAIVLVLALLSGAVLFVHVENFAPDKPENVEEQNDVRTRLLSFPSGILSRLSMFPGMRSKPLPFAVMIENHEDARPYHTALQDALMVQEFLVEGFISRFVVMFDARRIPAEIGPVRSLRPYFLDGIAPWARMVFHAGGSPEALSRVQNGDDFFAMNLLYYDGDSSLRKKGPLAPHNLFLTKQNVQTFLEEVPERFLQPAQWPPFAIGTAEGGEPAETVRVNFFNPLHNIVFHYLPLAQKYKRTNGEDVSEARPANVLVLEVPIDSIGEYGRLFMTTVGSGKAQLFHSGNVWEGLWSRKDIYTPYTISDAEGNELPFAQGQVWILVLPTLDRVSWE